MQARVKGHDEEARRSSLEKRDVKMDEELIRRQRDGRGSLGGESSCQEEGNWQVLLQVFASVTLVLKTMCAHLKWCQVERGGRAGSLQAPMATSESPDANQRQS